MARLGMCANLFSNHLWYWGDQHRDLILGPDRASRMNAAATALREGVPITLHSDSPVTPLDALATASYASSRRTPSGAVLGEHERISVPQALHAMTLGAAYTLKMDAEVGSLEAGKYADLAVLGDDPFETDADGLREIEVRGSMVGGTPFEVARPG
jgi:predicted amidohydrolase YtcJ